MTSGCLFDKDYEEFSLEEIEKHIIGIKSDSASNPILNPSIPLMEDERLVRIYSHLIGDGFGGGKYNRKTGGNFYANPAYTNTSLKLIDNFVKDLEVFGKVPYDKRDYGTYYKVIVPFVIKYLLEYVYGCEISASRGGLPKRFFELTHRLKFEIIRSFCDDEGTLRDNSIVISSGNKKQLKDLRIIMISVGFNKKNVLNVKKRKNNLFVLEFSNENFLNFGKNIKFFHPEKQKIMNFQIKRHATIKRMKPGESRRKIMDLLKIKPYASIELAMKLNISHNTTGQILRQLINANRIKRYRIPGKNKFEYKLTSESNN